MEIYFQYQQIQQAVRRHLSERENGTLEKQPPAPAIAASDDYILVGWDGPDDPLNPANQSITRKVIMTSLVALIALVVTAASSIDACGVKEYSEHFQVSQVVGSLATGLFLIGFAFGSLLSGPFSETFGRNAIYSTTMLVYLIFIMASALAPNLQAHLIFRFFAGFFASTPLTCAGGTVADLWDPVQKAYAFPVYAVPAFTGPVLGQVIGSYIPTTLGWRWLEWIMLILGGSVLVIVLLLQPETYGNLILYWKAKICRQETGDQRYRAPMEMKHDSLGEHLKNSVCRPFTMFYSELIIILMSLYLTIIYIILFTFLEGYTYVFGKTYGISQPLTSICWCGMLVGILIISFIVPVIYSWTLKEYQKTGAIAPETRLWYAMLGGAPAVPISLFWMGWTSDVCAQIREGHLLVTNIHTIQPSISIWSPLAASVLFGYGMAAIFIVAYMYLIDSYDIYSASALGFLVFTRYVVAGGITVAGGPIYRSIGVHYTLTILGSISAAMTPVPYLLYIYGPKIRKRSKYAVNVEK